MGSHSHITFFVNRIKVRFYADNTKMKSPQQMSIPDIWLPEITTALLDPVTITLPIL